MNDRVEEFAALHQRLQPLMLFNIWDAGSAQIVANCGAKALATGSFALAGAQGFADGEALPFDTLLTTVRSILNVVNLPLSMDIETGYGSTARQVGKNAEIIADAGVTGINIEDQLIDIGGLRDLSEQCERIEAAAKTGLFVNARTDLFIQTDPSEHDAVLADQAIERGRAFRNAGARSFFIPFISSEDSIAVICDAVDLPVNCMLFPGSPDLARLKELGVSRVSHGPGPWRAVMDNLQQNAEAFYD